MINNTRVGGVLFLVISLGYGYFAGEIPLDFWSEQEAFNARSLPRMIAAAGTICAIAMIVLPSAQTDWQAIVRLNWSQPVLLLGLMATYALTFDYLGFGIGTLLFLLIAFAVLGERRPIRMLAVAIPLVGGFWLLMDQLGIYLSPGLIIDQLVYGAEG